MGASTNGYLVGGEKITIVLPQQYTNPDLKWEQTAQTDIGIDFGFLNGKIRGSIDYYYKKTTDLLLSVAVPSPSLITTQIANVGTVTNQGIELDLSFDLMRTKDFAWDANLNLSHNKNEVVSLSNGQWTGDNMQVAPCQGQGLSGKRQGSGKRSRRLSGKRREIGLHKLRARHSARQKGKGHVRARFFFSRQGRGRLRQKQDNRNEIRF